MRYYSGTYAEYKAQNETFREVSLNAKENFFVECIMHIIYLNSTWPITMESFEKIGKDMLHTFKIIDN